METLNNIADVNLVNETISHLTIPSLFKDDNNVKTFGIVSAENPMCHRRTDEDNLQKGIELLDFLNTQQYMSKGVNVKYSCVEHAFIVYNISLEDMRTFGHMFDQKSFIYGNVINVEGKKPHLWFAYYEKEYPDKAKKDETGRKLKQYRREYQLKETKDIYNNNVSVEDNVLTVNGRYFNFSIKADVFKRGFESYNQFINERRQKCQEYADWSDMRIDRACDMTLTPWGRRVARAGLYGIRDIFK